MPVKKRRGRPPGSKNKPKDPRVPISGKLRVRSSEVRAYAREFTEEAIRELVKLMRFSKIEASKIAAAKELLDRGWGKPAQAMQISGDEDQRPIRIVHEYQRADGNVTVEVMSKKNLALPKAVPVAVTKAMAKTAVAVHEDS